MSEQTRRIEALLEPVLREKGYELVDLQYQKEGGRWVLRLFIDHVPPVTLADCQSVSGWAGDALDASNLIEQRFDLEVSSPGICRALRKPADFERFTGQRVAVQLYAPLDGSRKVGGILEGMEGDRIRVRRPDGSLAECRLAEIARAQLDPEIHF